MNRNPWQGARISAGLSIEPHPEHSGFWTLRGHDGKPGGAPEIDASSRDLLELGRLVLKHLQGEVSDGKVSWLRDYRASTGCDLRTAMDAWDEAHGRNSPAGNPAAES